MSDAPITANTPGGLSARDGEIALAALQCVKGGEIQIDYSALCNKLGFKNEASARSAWCSVRRKIEAKASSTDEPGTTPKAKTPRKAKDPNNATPKSGKAAPKAKATDNGDHDSVDGESNDASAGAVDGEVNQSEEAPTTPKTPTTPKKRARKTKAEKEAEAAANGEAATSEGDKDEKPPAKKRRTPAKKKATESEVNGEDESETKAAAAKGKKAPASRKTATTATDKDSTPAGSGEGELAIEEVIIEKKEEDGPSGEPGPAVPAVSTGTTNTPENGYIGESAPEVKAGMAAAATGHKLMLPSDSANGQESEL